VRQLGLGLGELLLTGLGGLGELGKLRLGGLRFEEIAFEFVLGALQV